MVKLRFAIYDDVAGWRVGMGGPVMQTNEKVIFGFLLMNSWTWASCSGRFSFLCFMQIQE